MLAPQWEKSDKYYFDIGTNKVYGPEKNTYGY
jgi:hypothetical protein